MSMNYQDCLKVLASKTRTERLKGLEIKIKPVPESDRHGIPDEREAAWMRRTQNSLGKNVLIEDMTLLTREDIQGLRDAMGCENQDLSENMITSHRVIKTEYGNIPLWIYTPCGTKQRPLVVYFHGGGFFGGTTRVVENACKLLAERSEAVVISVDYVLAPEYRFPKGLLQCINLRFHKNRTTVVSKMQSRCGVTDHLHDCRFFFTVRRRNIVRLCRDIRDCNRRGGFS